MQRTARRGAWSKRLFPVLDLELRLLTALPVVDLELEILGPDALLELERRTALVGAVVRALATEEGNQLVLAHLEVTEIQAVHAALEKRLDLARRVQVVDDFLLVDFQRDRVEREEITDIHGDEYRNLGIGREQQLFLENEQLAAQI